MEISEEKLEWRMVKQAFRKYRDNAQLLRRFASSDRPADCQLGFDFGTSGGIVDDIVLQKQDAKQYNDAIAACVSRLSTAERKIITGSYMISPAKPPWRIYVDELHIGRTLYFTNKSKAIGKLYVLFETQGIIKSPDF